MEVLSLCPCGSQRAFAACCAPYLQGEREAPTAESLMRSRYTAYTRREAPYLLRTWHPTTRPASLDLEKDRTHWLGLRVLAREAGQASDARGVVEFSADFLHEGKTRSLHERSEFVRVDGAWRYLSGTQPARAATPGRNEPCPCRSGKKYKHCCGA